MWQAVFTGEDNGKQQDEAGGREGGKLHEAIVDTQQSGFYYANKIYLQTPFGVTYRPVMGCGNCTAANRRIRTVLCCILQRPLLCGIKGMFLLKENVSVFSMQKHIDTILTFAVMPHFFRVFSLLYLVCTLLLSASPSVLICHSVLYSCFCSLRLSHLQTHSLKHDSHKPNTPVSNTWRHMNMNVINNHVGEKVTCENK